MQHLLGVDDLSHDFIFQIFDRASHIKQLRVNGSVRASHWDDLSQLLRNHLLVTMFFQPSTRTRLSFEAAMSHLGGKVIGTENAEEFSSFKKGASIEDEFRVISGYCDLIVGRFKNPGDARRAASNSLVPIINGGDGTGEHPTQALLDLFSIIERFPDADKVRITFVGDNKRSRTVQSLVMLLLGFHHVVQMNFISPQELMVDWSLLNMMRDRRGLSIDWTCENQLTEQILSQTDIVYVTRSQDEHGKLVDNSIIFGPEHAAMLPENAIILHPLPRNSELPTSVDSDPRAYYFEQARNGLYVRMALLEALCPIRRG